MEDKLLGYKDYKRINIVEMRPYVFGESLDGISVSCTDDPERDMGMIARNPKNHDDRWYVSRKYFEDNFEIIKEIKPENFADSFHN